MRIEKTLIESDKTGELFIRYTPHFVPFGGAVGELRFPPYDCELSGDHDATKAAAVENAGKTIAAWSEIAKCGCGL